MEPKNKLGQLRKNIEEAGKLVIAFSGGVDSTFLLKVAHDTLKEGVLAVTVSSSMFPDREQREAVEFCKQTGVQHQVVVFNEMEIEGFSDNPVDRCYLCKYQLFSKILELAKEKNIQHVADGSNQDDLDDYRPGMKALHQLGIRSLLREVGLAKEEIRALSKEMGLATWNKPSFACLASRFPYGTPITKEKLGMVEQAEQYLMDQGFHQVRVRYHGEIARIEVSPSERSKFYDELRMDEINQRFHKIGFKYTTMDLKGYRTGSLNEGLIEED